VRVVVADAAAHVRSALHLLLEQHPGVTCVAELATADGLVTVLDVMHADVLLVDSHVPDIDLASLLAKLRHDQPRLRVVVLSTRPEERERALAAGADAFVSKGDAPEGLFDSLARVDCPPF
jgi:two-component system, NarL family, invasion response regulator UvrY